MNLPRVIRVRQIVAKKWNTARSCQRSKTSPKAGLGYVRLDPLHIAGRSGDFTAEGGISGWFGRAFWGKTRVGLGETGKLDIAGSFPLATGFPR